MQCSNGMPGRRGCSNQRQGAVGVAGCREDWVCRGLGTHTVSPDHYADLPNMLAEPCRLPHGVSRWPSLKTLDTVLR